MNVDLNRKMVGEEGRHGTPENNAHCQTMIRNRYRRCTTMALHTENRSVGSGSWKGPDMGQPGSGRKHRWASPNCLVPL
jgi:hypothetical protein